MEQLFGSDNCDPCVPTMLLMVRLAYSTRFEIDNTSMCFRIHVMIQETGPMEQWLGHHVILLGLVSSCCVSVTTQLVL